MITSNPTHTLSVAIDVESLLKMVYAESAWRYFSQIAESQTSVLLDNDRRAIVPKPPHSMYDLAQWNTAHRSPVLRRLAAEAENPIPVRVLFQLSEKYYP